MTRPTLLVYHADRRYAELVNVPKRGVDVRIAATPSEAASAIAEAEILYAWKFPPQLYAKAGRLKWLQVDRKSTRLNSSHVRISYAVFCLKKKNKRDTLTITPSIFHAIRLPAIDDPT